MHCIDPSTIPYSSTKTCYNDFTCLVSLKKKDATWTKQLKLETILALETPPQRFHFVPSQPWAEDPSATFEGRTPLVLDSGETNPVH